MKIFFVCQRVPYPPNKGERTRAFHQIRWLAREHEVHVLALAEGTDEESAAESLRHHCASVEVFPLRSGTSRWRAALAAATGGPLTPAFFFSRELVRRSRELARLDPPAVVIACSSSTAQYARLFEGVPKVLDLVDVDSAKWSVLARAATFPWNLIYRLESRRLRSYERKQSEAFERIALTTSREVDKLAAFASTEHAFVLPTGIDVESLGALERNEAPVPTLVFTGQMDYQPNVVAIAHFAREVFPDLRRRRPTLELKVVGRRPTPAVRALADLAGVDVTGEVPEVAPYLARAWVFVAPLRESLGVPSKILEAMAAGLPTVASEAAARCLAEDVVEGRDLLVGRGDAELAAAIERLLSQQHMRERLGASGRRCARRSYSWRELGRRLERELLEIAPRPRPLAGPAATREVGVA